MSSSNAPNHTPPAGVYAAATLEVEARQGAVGPDEGVLHHVVRHVVSADHPESHPVHPALVTPDDLLESGQVSPLGAGQEARLVLAFGPHASPHTRRGLMASTYDTGEGGPVFQGNPRGGRDRPGVVRHDYSRILITTRRFWARCSFVLLSSTGLLGP